MTPSQIAQPPIMLMLVESTDEKIAEVASCEVNTEDTAPNHEDIAEDTMDMYTQK